MEPAAVAVSWLSETVSYRQIVRIRPLAESTAGMEPAAVAVSWLSEIASYRQIVRIRPLANFLAGMEPAKKSVSWLSDHTKNNLSEIAPTRLIKIGRKRTSAPIKGRGQGKRLKDWQTQPTRAINGRLWARQKPEKSKQNAAQPDFMPSRKKGLTAAGRRGVFKAR